MPWSSPAVKVCVKSPSLSSHSESDEPSSKKSAPGVTPRCMVSLMAGYTDPRLVGEGSTMRGEDAGLDDNLEFGCSRKIVRVAFVGLGGLGGSAGMRGCCLRGEAFDEAGLEAG
jgi:hypothetical protein